MSVDEILKEYKRGGFAGEKGKQEKAWKNASEKEMVREAHIEKVIRLSQQVFYEAEEKRELSYFEFLWEQAAYIRKYWWILQFLLLGSFWMLLHVTGVRMVTQRNLGILASLFVMIAMPELWKNQNCGAMEIEGAAYYSLRQIYSARLCLFAMVDVLLLSLFCGALSVSGRMTLGEMLVQFFLPLNVNCCICCRILCSGRMHSEYAAVAVSVLWSAVWFFFIWSDAVFERISAPVWAVSVTCSMVYLVFCVRKLLKSQVNYWEVNASWN